jgi:hypothetical protein
MQLTNFLAAGLHQHSHSWFWAMQDPWPYFSVSHLLVVWSGNLLLAFTRTAILSLWAPQDPWSYFSVSWLIRFSLGKLLLAHSCLHDIFVIPKFRSFLILDVMSQYFEYWMTVGSNFPYNMFPSFFFAVLEMMSKTMIVVVVSVIIIIICRVHIFHV